MLKCILSPDEAQQRHQVTLGCTGSDLEGVETSLSLSHTTGCWYILGK